MHPRKDTDPQVVGDIRILGRLGEGGMGRVYLGRTEDGDRVAVKTVHYAHTDKTAVVERFEREIAAMGMVQSPGTSELMTSSEPGESPAWLAMEYVPGLTLREHVDRSGLLDVEAAAALGLLLAEALAAVHDAGILHRDLKPTNVMMGPDGPKVIDFGLVAIGGAGGELTGSTTTLGTPLCMAPEQITDPKAVSEAADVYGLGATVLFAATGHFPVQRDSRDALLAAVATSAVPRDLSGLPAPLEPLFAAMLAFDPADRPDLGAVRTALREMVAASGRTPAAARAELARACYVPDPDDAAGGVVTDGPVPPLPPPVRPSPQVGTEDGVVVRVAERLRRDYARPKAA
ncbi:protein kinase-like protein [Murinocardiopsis flavida]|uniref:Protein kinase-like protein n=1 Tax=Murinocardiopsis flavida TaxID=645275 RepID=A0A2P8DP74_9ACTN|nr:serine/threonine-protein kinase [Murinocardiopsis flavida]PSK99024.1 protein kinase-like protein [Murinocardiopsis flavida]